MGDIFDRKTGRWHRIERGLFNSLRVTRLIYECVRSPTPDDFVFDGEKLALFELPEPKTPEPEN